MNMIIHIGQTLENNYMVTQIYQKGQKERCSKRITILDEMIHSRLIWERFVQERNSSHVILAIRQQKKECLKEQLGLKLDKDGLIRCYGRLQYAELPEGAKHPKLLPKKDYFSKIVIEDFHRKSHHVGISQTLTLIRQEYWIIQGRAAVKGVLKAVVPNLFSITEPLNMLRQTAEPYPPSIFFHS